MVPVLTQRGYHPDGWLGALVGSKLFYEFSDKYPFEQKIDQLTRELQNRLLTLKLPGSSASAPTPRVDNKQVSINY